MSDHKGIEEFKTILKFAASEEKISQTYNVPPNMLIPLLLSIKYGGDWSIKDEENFSVAVKDRETIYNGETKEGISYETIYLLVNPRIVEKEGRVHRIEKCGLSAERKLVQRSYNVKVVFDKGLIAKIDPEKKIIKIEKLNEEKIEFKGTMAFSLEHEIEHVSSEAEAAGKPIWDFNYIFEEE
ncbi:MAG: RimK/LysX family protein [Candidatus Freyarchaeota archaeon]|nr:RimK/LysX family protein [Candidatus Jordarchaeia archaeon]MBS7270377.1 RimK/LysX family protein [Candidatus Jordarchaeia archaeon]MBS7281341.1 RimK/LysX family protein [Candidatus Jordarchaeia archaeon]